MSKDWGPADWYVMTLGTAFLIANVVDSIKESNDEYERERIEKAIQSYVAQNTDQGLEIKVTEFVSDVRNFNTVYEYLEEFKRENPEWCKKRETHIQESRGPYWGDLEYYTVPVDYKIDWSNIGQKRFGFDHTNKEIVVTMIMNTLGVESVKSAVEKARKRECGEDY